jgi:hypothetical protein
MTAVMKKAGAPMSASTAIANRHIKAAFVRYPT